MAETPDKTRLDALIADLRKVPAFSDLAQDELEWFVGQAEERRLESGQAFIKGRPPAAMKFGLLEGELRGRREAGGPDGPVISIQAPAVTGLLPFSRLKIFPMTIRSVVPARAVLLRSSYFPEMLRRIPELAQRLVALLTDQVR